MQVLKALTTTRCNENFNMEALELFGDSFLKYAVSRKLFLESSTANEGVLSTRRIRSICNEALHKLAVDRGLSVRLFFWRICADLFYFIEYLGLCIPFVYSLYLGFRSLGFLVFVTIRNELCM